jgi:tRNA-dependent cyclodipeptide synthase
MDAQPIIESCARWLQQREHACFGISPFNGYFSERRIRTLAGWGLREFRSIHFFSISGVNMSVEREECHWTGNA